MSDPGLVTVDELLQVFISFSIDLFSISRIFAILSLFFSVTTT